MILYLDIKLKEQHIKPTLACLNSYMKIKTLEKITNHKVIDHLNDSESLLHERVLYRMVVSAIKEEITYGSPLDAGRRSSK